MVVLLASAALVLLGVGLTARAFLGDDGPSGVGSRGGPVGELDPSEVLTSFGAVALEGASNLGRGDLPSGPGNHDAGSRGHTAGHTRVRVQVRVENMTGRPILFSPGQFRLRAGRSTIAPAATQLDPGPLAAGQSLRTALVFLVAPRVRRLSLEFQDTGRASPIRIDLGAHANHLFGHDQSARRP